LAVHDKHTVSGKKPTSTVHE